MITMQLRRRALRQRALHNYAMQFEADYNQRLNDMFAVMDPYEYRKQMDALSEGDRAELRRELDAMPDEAMYGALDVAISGLNGTLFKRYGMGALLRRSLCEVRSHLIDAADQLSYGELFGARENLDEALALIDDLLNRRNQVAKRAERVLVDDPHAKQEVSDIAQCIKQAQRGVLRSTWSRTA